MLLVFFFFFNDTATTEIYTLSLHDALPISSRYSLSCLSSRTGSDFSVSVVKLRTSEKKTVSLRFWPSKRKESRLSITRSEEHTSELQSRLHLVCRLLLEKKNKKNINLRSIT